MRVTVVSRKTSELFRALHFAADTMQSFDWRCIALSIQLAQSEIKFRDNYLIMCMKLANFIKQEGNNALSIKSETKADVMRNCCLLRWSWKDADGKLNTNWMRCFRVDQEYIIILNDFFIEYSFALT